MKSHKISFHHSSHHEISFGSFLKLGYHQIIHFRLGFPILDPFLGTPILRTPHRITISSYFIIKITSHISSYFINIPSPDFISSHWLNQPLERCHPQIFAHENHGPDLSPRPQTTFEPRRIHPSPHPTDVSRSAAGCLGPPGEAAAPLQRRDARGGADTMRCEAMADGFGLGGWMVIWWVKTSWGDFFWGIFFIMSWYVYEKSLHGDFFWGDVF